MSLKNPRMSREDCLFVGLLLGFVLGAATLMLALKLGG
jgi:hypothetical protein